MIITPTLAAVSPIGRLFGLLFKPPKIEAQRLGELSQQTAKEGEPRPIVYGIGRPIGGNIMYMSQPIKRMVKTYVGKAGGKGGGKKKKQYQDVEHVYRYYAIRVCEGPISGFRRIWRNGALVYDARKGSDWGAKNNHLFFKNYRLYTGSWDQMPDSMLQSRWGMDIPAHRGTAYLVADNEDLTDFGGAIPQWQFEVVRSEGYYLTSRPYALEEVEAIEPGVSGLSSRLWGTLKTDSESIKVGVSDLSAAMRNIRRVYDIGFEAIDPSVADLAVTMRRVSQRTDIGFEAINPSVGDLNVRMRVVRRGYVVETESIDPSVADLAVSITRR